jgi:putative oxidoreductase
MKNVLYTVLRVLCGLLFVAFGAMKFFPMPVPQGFPPAVMTFFAGLAATGYFMPLLATIEVIIGLMFLFNFWPALATIMLVPVSINIALFDLILQPPGFFVGIIPLLFNIYFVFYFKEKYVPMLTK